jgi:hypothetical protein
MTNNPLNLDRHDDTEQGPIPTGGLVPLLKKRAGGREIYGLQAYEE